MDRGWSLKKLHRLIVTSATYRQSSDVTPGTARPRSRQPPAGPRPALPRRAEIVRDIALAASGLLNPRVGGPSVYPPAPEFLFLPPASYGPKIWDEEHGPDRYRRALYTFRFRSVPYPVLQTFDAPNGDFACVRRARSNTPLQALTTLNEPLFLECARPWRSRCYERGVAKPEQRLNYAFRRCLSRAPTPDEDDDAVGPLITKKQTVRRAQTAAAEFTPTTRRNPLALPAGSNDGDNGGVDGGLARAAEPG